MLRAQRRFVLPNEDSKGAGGGGDNKNRAGYFISCIIFLQERPLLAKKGSHVLKNVYVLCSWVLKYDSLKGLFDKRNIPCPPHTQDKTTFEYLRDFFW